MISRSFSVAVMVKDADKSTDWYKEKLGFQVASEEHWVTAWPRGASWRIHLCQGDLEPGNTGIALYCTDLEGTANLLKKRGVKFHKDVTKAAWGNYAQIEDPDGNIIWLIEGRP